MTKWYSVTFLILYPFTTPPPGGSKHAPGSSRKSECGAEQGGEHDLLLGVPAVLQGAGQEPGAGEKPGKWRTRESNLAKECCFPGY